MKNKKIILFTLITITLLLTIACTPQTQGEEKPSENQQDTKTEDVKNKRTTLNTTSLDQAAEELKNLTW